jgi:ABC-type nitrate/sulfonate/bicarbonate transport system substrate-binding protein
LFNADWFWNDALLSKNVCELLLLSNHFTAEVSGLIKQINQADKWVQSHQAETATAIGQSTGLKLSLYPMQEHELGLLVVLKRSKDPKLPMHQRHLFEMPS